MASLFAENAYLPMGWASNVRIEWEDSEILRVTPQSAPQPEDSRVETLVPAIPNLHSHAFQRVLAGLAESTQGKEDDFWTWREAMYAVAAWINPERLYTIAVQLYGEMVAAGYNHVAEFHYLHQPHPLEMSLALIQAAKDVGIGLTLLPVLYQQGGFGRQALQGPQKGFFLETDEYLRLIEDLRAPCNQQIRLGWAPHSLRAVDTLTLQAVSASLGPLPCHIHISEQMKEVEQCLASYDHRPVQWLYKHMDVSAKWCLVHATHLVADEIQAITSSGATVALCPTTEANLGDGFFSLEAFQKLNGRWGIGSDSNSSVSPFEELRWLEYGQRLLHRKRNIAAGKHGSSGTRLLNGCWTSASAVLDRKVGRLEVGYQADWLVLDSQNPNLFQHAHFLDAVVFSGNRNPVLESWVSGRLVAQKGEANYQDPNAFRQLLHDLRGAL